MQSRVVLTPRIYRPTQPCSHVASDFIRISSDHSRHSEHSKHNDDSRTFSRHTNKTCRRVMACNVQREGDDCSNKGERWFCLSTERYLRCTGIADLLASVESRRRLGLITTYVSYRPHVIWGGYILQALHRRGDLCQLIMWDNRLLLPCLPANYCMSTHTI